MFVNVSNHPSELWLDKQKVIIPMSQIQIIITYSVHSLLQGKDQILLRMEQIFRQELKQGM